MILPFPILDPMWLNAAEFDIAVSSTVVLRWGQWYLGAFCPFLCDHTYVNVSPSSSPFIFLSELLACLNFLFFAIFSSLLLANF